MSVIIRENDGRIKLLIKGADNIIKARLSKKTQPFLKFIEGQLDEFSKIGLRTLLMAMKLLSETEYEEFNKKFQALADSKKREEELST
jgi:magnesium-transporting ATPase (P-type)